jgi:hypothetical protein
MMPKFLDVHSMKGFTEESLRKSQTELPDEFGVTTENTMFNIEADILYCLLNAPNKEAVEKHHEKYGAKCEWIMEIKTTA